MLVLVLVVQWILLIGIAIALFALAQQVGVLHTRLGPVGGRVVGDGPPIGVPLPSFVAHDERGKPFEVPGDVLTARTPTLLVFLSSGCSPCRRLMPGLITFASDHREITTVAFVRSAEDAWSDFAREYASPDIRYGDASILPDSVAPSGTPYVVVLNEDGLVVSKGMVNHYEQIESLVSPSAWREIDERLALDAR